MGISSYTESIMYVYMKYKGHSFNNASPLFNSPPMGFGPQFLQFLLKSIKKFERHSQIIIFHIFKMFIKPIYRPRQVQKYKSS